MAHVHSNMRVAVLPFMNTRPVWNGNVSFTRTYKLARNSFTTANCHLYKL